VRDLAYESAYPAITGAIFEFGFPDAIQQMWAAFCDELASRHSGRPMRQPYTCATAEEAEASHVLFDASVQSASVGAAMRVSASREGGGG
jgi:hypothetical protein